MHHKKQIQFNHFLVEVTVGHRVSMSRLSRGQVLSLLTTVSDPCESRVVVLGESAQSGGGVLRGGGAEQGLLWLLHGGRRHVWRRGNTYTPGQGGGGLPGNHRATRTDADRSSIAVLAATSFKHTPTLWRGGSHSIGLPSLSFDTFDMFSNVYMQGNV